MGNISAFLSEKVENQKIIKKVRPGSTTELFTSSNLAIESSTSPVRRVELQL